MRASPTRGPHFGLAPLREAHNVVAVRHPFRRKNLSPRLIPFYLAVGGGLWLAQPSVASLTLAAPCYPCNLFRDDALLFRASCGKRGGGVPSR